MKPIPDYRRYARAFIFCAMALAIPCTLVAQVKGKSIALGIYECFDNDSPELTTEKMRHLGKFRLGLEHCYRREFGEAIRLFDQIVKANPDDNVVKKFRNETAQLILQEVPEDWTGVAKLDFK